MNSIILVALLNLASVGADGYSTLYHAEVDYRGYHFSRPPEYGLAAPLIGARPTWQSMAPWGALEVCGLTSISYLLRRWHVQAWWMPQAAISMVHLYCAGCNIRARMGDRARMDALIAADQARDQSANIAYQFNF